MNPLLPFLMAGDPSLEALPGLLSEAKALGLEAIELGLPHSDPIADGPVLQAAAHRAIARGATPLRVLESLSGLGDSPDIILFTYLNPLLQIGAGELKRLLAPTPIKALLVVDLPFGEESGFESDLRAAGYPMVPLLAPTTSLDRARRILSDRPDPGPSAPFAQRFAYVVARLGGHGNGAGHGSSPRLQAVGGAEGPFGSPPSRGFRALRSPESGFDPGHGGHARDRIGPGPGAVGWAKSA